MDASCHAHPTLPATAECCGCGRALCARCAAARTDGIPACPSADCRRKADELGAHRVALLQRMRSHFRVAIAFLVVQAAGSAAMAAWVFAIGLDDSRRQVGFAAMLVFAVLGAGLAIRFVHRYRSLPPA